MFGLQGPAKYAKQPCADAPFAPMSLASLVPNARVVSAGGPRFPLALHRIGDLATRIGRPLAVDVTPYECGLRIGRNDGSAATLRLRPK